MSIEVMKQALDVLENTARSAVEQYVAEQKAITVLRQAIEQAEKQEPDLSIEANRVAYEVAMYYANKTKEMLSKPEQEPVAWMYVNIDGECEQIEYGACDYDDPSITFLYTAPPRKEWVGLNWDDIPEVFVGDIAFMQGAKWALAKLKEKNI